MENCNIVQYCYQIMTNFGMMLKCWLMPSCQYCLDKLMKENSNCIKRHPYISSSWPKLMYQRIFGESQINLNEYLIQGNENCLNIFKNTQYVKLESYDEAVLEDLFYFTIGVTAISSLFFYLRRKYAEREAH